MKVRARVGLLSPWRRRCGRAADEVLTLLAALILSSSSSSSSTHAAVTGTAGALGRPPPTCCDMCSVTRPLRHIHHNQQRVGAIIHFIIGCCVWDVRLMS